MKRFNPPAVTHRAVAITVALGSAALLALGTAAATPAAAVTPSPRPTVSASPTPSPGTTSSPAASRTGTPSSSKPGGSHGTACTTDRRGRLTDCPRPLPASRLPAGARNRAQVTTPVSDLAALVDTRTWTSGGGNTYPGAEVPYGMVQWSPDTSPNRSAGGGYNYGDTSLMGYSLTHISGPGCGAAGDVPILPMTGALPSGDPDNVTTSFTNTGEVAQAGYYSAQSNGPDNTITSQFTATPRSALGQFTFPSTTAADFLIKLQDSQNGDFGDSAQIVGNNEVTGTDTSGNFCGETVNDGQVQQYTVNFDIVFSQPFTASRVITASGQTDPQAVFLTFDTTANPVIDAKVAISYVSTANAQQDLQAMSPGWDFAGTQATAQRTWDHLLGKIQVSGGTYAQTQEFYSLLYKDFMQPNIVSDVNGQYMGADMKVATISAPQQAQYGTYSGWDIYHSLAQLQAVLDPRAASDQAQSLVNYYAQDGILQQWGYLNLNNYVMVGDPAQAIIADYYAYGAHHFNTQQALADMLKQATTVNDVRPGEAMEAQYGYLPEDGTYHNCCNFHGVVASLLEDDTSDLALASFARALGDYSDAAMLTKRANNWENMFNPSNGLLTARYQNGQFESGVVGTTQQNNEPDYVEGDAYEYLWDVPNNYKTLFSLLGGDSKVVPALQQYLSQPNGSGMYALLSNEFDFGEQYALNYAGDPAGTQQAVNTILTTMATPGPSGLPNNDDLGANSSMTLWEMLGMYPENSGTGTLDISGPHFPHESIQLANGRAITINAPAASATNYYIQSLRVNGERYNRNYLEWNDLQRGATLDYALGSQPSTWASAPEDAPPSYTSGIKSAVGYLPTQQADVAPGGSTTVQVGAVDATGRAQTVQASISAPAGVTVTPAAGSISVPADGTGDLTITVSATSSTPQTFYKVPITITTASGATQTLTLLVLVAPQGSLLRAFNNNGIADDASPGGTEFDTSGYAYSQQALAAQGLVAGQSTTVNGVQFSWPLPSSGFPDNAIASGQQITVSAPAGTQTLGFLGAASNGPSEGVATLHYSDGSTARYWLGLSDWTLNGGSSKPSYGNTVAASTTYRDCAGCTGGQQTVGTDVFSTSLPVDAGKTLTSVTLPSQVTAGNLHIFAIGTSAQPQSPPTISSLSPATASAGQQVTINGSGFGATQGPGYVALSDNGVNWGAPGNTAAFQVDSWSDTAITFTVPTPSASSPYAVTPGTAASVLVANGSGGVSAMPVLSITPTANPADYYDNAGISGDSSTACANYDGDGYSYSAQALAAAGLTPGGTVTADGLTFTWPNVAACANDNILASGQDMLVHGTAGASKLGLLESSTNGGTTGTVTISYTDGTSTTQALSSSDWAGGPGTSETAVATMPYRNMTSGGSQPITMYVYATTIPVDSSKTVASITFPDVSNAVGSNTSAMHIFAISLG